MTALLKLIGEIVDPFGPPNFDRFIPIDLRGKSIEQRATETIAKGFQEGVASVIQLYPEIENVQKDPLISSSKPK